MQNVLLPFASKIRVALPGRGIPGRGSRQSGQQSGLGKIHLGYVMTKIVLRGHLHPVRTVTEVDLVEVQVEDLILPQRPFEAIGQDGLPYLS
jgi:hypothetical protein